MALVRVGFTLGQRFLASDIILTELAKRWNSSCDDACCGVRKDCKTVACRHGEEKCWFATRHRHPCKDFVIERKPHCDYNPCEILPMFDWLYYRTSDKINRKYQKTWRDCPPVIKKVCCYPEIPKFPPYKKRIRTNRDACRPPTACEANGAKFGAICKIKDPKELCQYIEAPCCVVGRKPPKCREIRDELSDCVKDCCPFPAYSECCQRGRAVIPGRVGQCTCIYPGISGCETHRYTINITKWPPED